MLSEECYMKNSRDVFWEHDRTLVDIQPSLNDVTTNKKELEKWKRVYRRSNECLTPELYFGLTILHENPDIYILYIR